MRYVKLMIVLLIIFLICRISNGQGVVKKYHMGDTVDIDTCVCMDVDSYRAVRKAVKISPRFVQSQDSLINAYQKKAQVADSLIAVKDNIILRQTDIIARKDSLNASILRNYDKLESTTIQTLNYVEDHLPKKNLWTFISKPPFWIGLGVGVVGGVFLMR